MEKAVIPYLIDNILDEVESSYTDNEQITDDVLLSLFGIFDKVLTSALELIESNSITIMHIKNCFTKTDQFLFQVIGSSHSAYILFHRVNYCQCKFYQQKVLYSKSYPACKHFLAANLAYTWKKCRKFEIDFDKYKDLIKSITTNV